MSGISRSLRHLITRLDSLRGSHGTRANHIFTQIEGCHSCHTQMSNFATLTRHMWVVADHEVMRVAPVAQLNLNQRRFKKKRARNSKEEEEEEDDDDDDELANENPLLVDDILSEANDGSEALTIDINSLRLDAFCKTAFSLTRAKVEEAFYRGDIKINGELPIKKSVDVMTGDEIDILKHVDAEDNKLIHVRKALVETIPDKATEHGRMKIKIKRWQDLVVEKPDTKGGESV